jgi:hypothetical protein
MLTHALGLIPSTEKPLESIFPFCLTHSVFPKMPPSRAVNPGYSYRTILVNDCWFFPTWKIHSTSSQFSQQSNPGDPGSTALQYGSVLPSADQHTELSTSISAPTLHLWLDYLQPCQEGRRPLNNLYLVLERSVCTNSVLWVETHCRDWNLLTKQERSAQTL